MALLISSGTAAAAIEVDKFALESVSASRSTSQAGAHPDLTTLATVATDPASAADGDGDKKPFAHTRDLSIALPPGMTGNPHAVARCSAVQFATAFEEGGGCPTDSQVGVAVLHLAEFNATLTEPIFNLEAPGDDEVARLGFYGYVVPVIIDVNLRTDRDYSLEAAGKGFYTLFPLVSVETRLWGVPASHVHDTERLTVKEVTANPGISESPPRPSGMAPMAFLNNPTTCGGPLDVDFAASSYQAPDRQVTATAQMPATTGCGSLDFGADLSMKPSSSEADSASGLDAELTVDQTNISQPGGFAPANLKKATVTLPEGISINPSSAGGLTGCSEAEVGLISSNPIRFDAAPEECPGSAKIGTATIESPVLDGPVDGSLYVARQRENPFGGLLSGYLVAEGHGATIKLAGRFDLDPNSGRITATFDGNPQQPFSRLRLHFKGGSRGVLVTPPQCGRYEIDSTLVPWSALDPDNPAPSEVVEDSSFFDIASGPGGTPCPNPPKLSPSFAGGTVTPLAGSYSPLIVRASRPDGSQAINRIDVDLPQGLVGRLAGIPYCSEAALAAAASRSGADELASASCPAASRVGSVDTGAGAGSTPFYVRGSAYLAGPYKGAPLSLAIVTPAVAGPFDLGNVVVRTALRVDPVTAQVHAVSDPLPTILQGIPLHLRSVSVNADRDRFALNPTSCEAKSVDGTISSPLTSVSVFDRFRVGGCGALDFGPRLSLKLRGGTQRGAHPALRAVLRAKSGDSNIERASVALPRSEFLEQAHIQTVCTRVQFAADACPRGSVYGRARAFTPLLDEPLEGPVYLRSSDNRLPDLVADLQGQIDIEVAGRIDSVNNGIRTTFSSLPDAPVTKFVLSMKGGRKGLLVNSRNLCARPWHAAVKMRGHNEKTAKLRPKLKVQCRGGAENASPR